MYSAVTDLRIGTAGFRACCCYGGGAGCMSCRSEPWTVLITLAMSAAGRALPRRKAAVIRLVRATISSGEVVGLPCFVKLYPTVESSCVPAPVPGQDAGPTATLQTKPSRAFLCRATSPSDIVSR